MRKADFGGWATKFNTRCSDGRTIMPGAFAHQNRVRVPLVWQHGHDNPKSILGHAILEDRGTEGIYTYAFFNNSPSAKHAKEAVKNGDINRLSIWANGLIEKAKQVMHGTIREVSLVMAGANPGAIIENVNIQHMDGDIETLADQAIIHSGTLIDLTDLDYDDDDDIDEHQSEGGEAKHNDTKDGDMNRQDIYDSMSDDQKQLLHSLLDEALEVDDEDSDDILEHALGEDATVQDVYNSLTAQQKDVVHYMIGLAVEEAKTAKHDDMEGNNTMSRNVFEQQEGTQTESTVLSHDDLKAIVKDAQRKGSLRHAFEDYAEEHLEHGINDIDTLFPDATLVDNQPQLIQRRTEWVNKVLGGATKRPFARIKTLYADITEDEARARGYIKGSLKKEEFFSVAKRETTPTTVYKKQKLDRDDMIDIVDFDVVMWLKGEMRLMLDEEIARAILLGDGRDVASSDKISETNIRPIASDHELFAVTVNVNITDASSSVQEVIDAVVRNRKYYKGSGQPTLFCGEDLVSDFMLLKDGFQRPMYTSLEEVARVLRVREIVPVELIDEDDSLIGIIVNPSDYSIGTDKGGKVSMFEDFDIDYNQEKYLIETRMSGALTKLKSALVLRSVTSTLVLVVPDKPAFDAVDGELTITDKTGVVYKDSEGTTLNNAGSPYAVASGESITVVATPAAGYFFESTEADEWTFTAE